MLLPRYTRFWRVSSRSSVVYDQLANTSCTPVAVSAFKIVIELELKRRDNDKKVKLLFLEMKNMMSALLQ